MELFERYQALLTDHQREVMELHLRSDWSLAEIAEEQGTSRAAVHDIIRRSNLALGDYESRLGLLAEARRRRRVLGSIEKEITTLGRRIARMEATA